MMHKIHLFLVAIGVLIFAHLGHCAEAVCRDIFKTIPNHSACLKTAPNAKPGKVDKQQALDAHNKYRSIIQGKYKATNMLKTVWDDEIAMVAQSWAENCNVGHDDNKNRNIPGRFSVGQNIASGPSILTWDSVVQLFYNESAKYTYGQAGQNVHLIGHFTQLAWAASYILGCGYSVCQNGGSDTHFYVCNYAPSGNHNGELGTPFEKGSGTVCKKEENGLCDCGSTICEMNSKLDPATCQCNCTKSYFGAALSFVTGSSCRLSCSQTSDPGYCNQSYNSAKCRALTNAPFECPFLCGVCPYAGVGYQEGSAGIPGNNGGGSNGGSNGGSRGNGSTGGKGGRSSVVAEFQLTNVITALFGTLSIVFLLNRFL